MKIYLEGKCLSILFPKLKFFVMMGFYSSMLFNFFIGKSHQSNNFVFQVIFLGFTFEVIFVNP